MIDGIKGFSMKRIIIGLFGIGGKSTWNVMEDKTPIIRCSICTGEQVAGFKDNKTGKFEDIMLIKSENDLDEFKKMYGITGDIDKEY